MATIARLVKIPRGDFPEAPQRHEIAIMFDGANALAWVHTPDTFRECTVAAVAAAVYLDFGEIPMPLEFPALGFSGVATIRFSGPQPNRGQRAAKAFVANVLRDAESLDDSALFAILAPAIERAIEPALAAGDQSFLGDLTDFLRGTPAVREALDFCGFYLARASGKIVRKTPPPDAPIPLPGTSFTIGRMPKFEPPKAQLLLEMPENDPAATFDDFKAMSRVHASVSREGGNVFIADNSANGTFMNGVRITGKTRLAEGVLEFGSQDAPPWRRLEVSFDGPRVVFSAKSGKKWLF